MKKEKIDTEVLAVDETMLVDQNLPEGIEEQEEILTKQQSNSDNNKRIAKNTLLLYFRMFFTMGVSLYTSRVILNALGVDDYGIYNVVGSVVTMFSFLNGAMSASTSRYLTIAIGQNDDIQLNRIFNASIINHLIIAFVLVILAETIGLWFLINKMVFPESHYNAVIVVYQFSVVSTAITLLQTPFLATIIAYERMNIFAWGGILDSLLKLGIALGIMSINGQRLVVYAVLLFIVTAGMFIYYFTSCKIQFKNTKIKFLWDWTLLKELFSYSGWDLLGNLSVIAQGQGLNILLNLFFGPSVNASRGIAYQVQGAVAQFSGNFMTAVRPQIIKYYAAGDYSNMMLLVFKSARFSFLLLWLVSFPILIEIDFILTLWLKNVPDYTVVFARIVIIVSLINSWRFPFISVMHATGQIKLPNIIIGGLLIATLPISYVVLKSGFNPESVFYIILFMNIIALFLDWALIKRNLFFSIKAAFKDIILKSSFVSIASFIVVYVLKKYVSISNMNSILFIFLSIIIAVFFSFLIGLKSIERNDIRVVLLKYLKKQQ